jgi:hypothetical protein
MIKLSKEKNFAFELELAPRSRCHRKGKLDHGRPGSYDPDIDNGVSVRPFQETGLLTKNVISKWQRDPSASSG